MVMPHRWSSRKRFGRLVVVITAMATLLPAVHLPAYAGADSARPTAGLYESDLSDDATFSIILVIGKSNAKKIDLVNLACAPDGIYDLQNIFTIDEDVKIRGGKFTVRHDQVVVKGRFTKPNLARGTIKPRRSFTDPQACGIPDKGRWTSECSLGIEKTAQAGDSGDGLTVSSSISTGDNGTTIARFSGGGFETVEPTADCAE